MIKQANETIRTMITENKLKHYWISEELGISQYTFCHWLQTELPETKQKAVLEAIKRVIDSQNNTEENNHET